MNISRKKVRNRIYASDYPASERMKFVCAVNVYARFICVRVAHCFTFSTGSVVVQWLTEVQELVIDVNISDAASEMFVEDWEFNW